MGPWHIVFKPSLQKIWPLIVVAFILIVVKMLLISAYGNATPFWDQWDAEADYLYRPWLEGTFSWSHLLGLHNEHRIVTTRILGLVLLEMNGRVWNPILQMQVNALLHVLATCVLLYFVTRVVPEKLRLAIYIFVAFVFSIPFGWENTLAGFQSQFYFLLLFSFVFLWSMAACESYSLKWWAGILAGILCTLSLASGAITIIAGAVISILRKWLDRPGSGVASLGIVLLFAIALTSIALTPSLPRHDYLKASGLSQFIVVFLRILSWPDFRFGIGVFVIHIPFLFFTLKVIRNSSFRTPAHYFILAVGIWVIGQFLTIAYGRANGFASSRYQDIYAIGLIVGFASLLTLSKDSSSRKVFYSAGTTWLCVVAFGFITLSDNLANTLKFKAALSLIQERNVRNYLCTGDFQHLSNKPQLHIPYPDPVRLRSLLDNYAIRLILPGNIYESNGSSRPLSNGNPFCPPNIFLMRDINNMPEDAGGDTVFVTGNQIVVFNDWTGSDYYRTSLKDYKVWGSFINGDQDTGSIFLKMNRGESLYYRSGPAGGNQLLSIDGESFGSQLLPVATNWVILEFSGSDLSETFTVELKDAGSAWGEWSAIALKN